MLVHELNPGNFFRHVMAREEDKFNRGGAAEPGAQGDGGALTDAVDVGGDGAFFGRQVAHGDVTVGGEEGAFPMHGFLHVGADEQPGGGVGEQRGAAHAAGVGGGTGGGGDKDTVADEAWQAGDIIDLNFEPGALAAGTFHPGVVEGVDVIEGAVLVLDFEVEKGELPEDDFGGGEGRFKHGFGGIHEEAERACIDAEKREPATPVFTDGAQHGAVAAEGEDEVGIGGVGVADKVGNPALGFGVVEVGLDLMVPVGE